jgi:hypothetical protein
MNIKKIINIVMCISFFLSNTTFGYADNYKRIVALKERYLPNPEYYKSYFSCYYSEEINPYELHALISLETREQIKKMLQKDELYLKADRLIIIVTSTLLAEVSSVEKALVEWRQIPQKLGRSLDQFTKIQRAILDAADEKIISFYNGAQDCKKTLSNTIAEVMKQRILTSHNYHDNHQCDQTATRSIDVLKMRNIKMSVESEYIDLIKKAYINNPDCPILEQLKNHQIFNIGNFDNSKGAFIVHDIYDHFWFAMKLEDSGLFGCYSNLLLWMGNPHLSDIFSREGELIATIASHFRWFHFAEKDYKPLFSIEDIITILEHSKANGTFSDNQERAYALIKAIKPESTLFKALPFVLSDMILQMLKYITINGYPKHLNELYQSQGYFDPLDPEHIAFVAEATNYLFAHYDQVIKVLLNVTMWIENYLVGVAQGIEQEDLVVDLEEAECLEDSTKFTRLSAKKIQWMKDNIGFEVVRYPVGQ